MKLLSVQSEELRFASCMTIYEDAFSASERIPNERIRRMINQGLTTCYALEDSGTVVAFALVHLLKESEAAWLDYFAVERSRRGKGIGTELVQSIARRHGSVDGENQRLFLEVGDDEGQEGQFASGWARRVGFYLRSGARLLKDVRYRFPGYGATGPIPMSLLVFAPDSIQELDRSELKGILEELFQQVHSRGSKDAILRGTTDHFQAQVVLSSEVSEVISLRKRR